jgi:hypothetical protein
MNAQTTSSKTGPLSHPGPWVVAWIVAWLGARLILDVDTTNPAWLKILAALIPAPLAGVALLSILRSARELDELEKRIQLEALAFAFVLSVLVLMTLGLMELAVVLNRDDWSYRHVWAMLPMLYFAGVILARRRYS